MNLYIAFVGYRFQIDNLIICFGTYDIAFLFFDSDMIDNYTAAICKNNRLSILGKFEIGMRRFTSGIFLLRLD